MTIGNYFTLVFIDQFYYAVNTDLLKINFYLNAPGLQKKVFKVKFADEVDSEVPFDLVSFKYVKHVAMTDSRFPQKYFTFDPTKSYQGKIEDDFDPNQPIELSKSSRLVHKCPYSVLSIDQFHFCFDRLVSTSLHHCSLRSLN